eukprot:8658899-Pyramimonas_sp.AAC.1
MGAPARPLVLARQAGRSTLGQVCRQSLQSESNTAQQISLHAASITRDLTNYCEHANRGKPTAESLSSRLQWNHPRHHH